VEAGSHQHKLKRFRRSNEAESLRRSRSPVKPSLKIDKRQTTPPSFTQAPSTPLPPPENSVESEDDRRSTASPDKQKRDSQRNLQFLPRREPSPKRNFRRSRSNDYGSTVKKRKRNLIDDSTSSHHSGRRSRSRSLSQSQSHRDTRVVRTSPSRKYTTTSAAPPNNKIGVFGLPETCDEQDLKVPIY
jgi:hypothetical protein